MDSIGQAADVDRGLTSMYFRSKEDILLFAVNEEAERLARGVASVAALTGRHVDVALGTSWLGSPHRYEIEWTATGIVFRIQPGPNQTATRAVETSTVSEPNSHNARTRTSSTTRSAHPTTCPRRRSHSPMPGS